MIVYYEKEKSFITKLVDKTKSLFTKSQNQDTDVMTKTLSTLKDAFESFL
jgi:hypothetical protein